MHITTLGDVMLDVIVEVPGGLVLDDDVEATITLTAGGQAANVAVWAVTLGARATVIGPRGSYGASGLITAGLEVAGVDFKGIDFGDTGTVVSIVEGPTRSMASDAGDQSWLTHVTVDDLPDEIDWLHISGYPVLRALDPGPVFALATAARQRGARISLDVASATLLMAYRAEAFARVVDRLAVDALFANRDEWAIVRERLSDLAGDIIVKEGPQGATVMTPATAISYPSLVGEAVDPTGAGDALAAGYLVGGIDLALQTAARCVASRGAQPDA
jgi:ribokinase